MGWSHRLAEQRRRHREFSQAPVLGYCPPGQERVRQFYSRCENRRYQEYRYRAPDGELFATIAPTLAVARHRRDLWQMDRELSALAHETRGQLQRTMQPPTEGPSFWEELRAEIKDGR